jgi:hypothetical protein
MTDAERRQRAEEIFTDTHSRYMKNWAVISSLRQFRDAALEGAAQLLTEQHAAFVNLFRTEPEYRRIFTNPEQPVPENILQILQTQMTEGVIINAHAAIDASSLVMAQSILDDCAWSYLKVCALIAPEDWRGQIDARKVDLKTVREQSYEDLRDGLIQARVDQIERESVLVKIDLLFSLCKPPADYAPLNNYAYDRARLVRIDGERHAVIHENGFVTPLPTIEEDLDYISKTAWFVMGLVNQKHGLRIDPRRFMGVQMATPQEVPEPPAVQ